MTNRTISRRFAIKTLFAGAVVTLGAGCNTLNSLPRRQTGGETDGSELALKVRNELRENAFTSQLTLDISSEEDEVIIKGFVNTRADIANIEMVANQVDGVRHAFVDVFVLD